MRREIQCKQCGTDMEARQGDGSQYPGEHIRYVHGVTLPNPHMSDGVSRCDSCYAALPAGTPCVAVSIWTDREGLRIAAWDWEKEYMQADETA